MGQGGAQQEQTQARAFGALAGMAVGDALGMPSQTLTREEIRRQYGQITGFVAPAPDHPVSHGLVAGQVTDDTEQALLLARRLIEGQGRIDEARLALDKSLRIDMQFELKRIQREIGITTIFVTHDQEEALTLSDKIGILREGRMIQAGPPREVYNNPADLFTATFLGEANILSEISGEGADVKRPPGQDASGTLAVRPEHLTLSKAEPVQDGLSKCQGVLERRVFAGAMATCVLRSGGAQIKVIARDQDIPDSLVEGDRLWLSWPVEKTLCVPDR